MCLATMISSGKKAKLQQRKSLLKLYKGMIITPLGQCKVQAEYQGKVNKLKFQVLQTTQKPLLSAKTSELMNLATKLGQTIHTIHIQAKQPDPEQTVYCGVAVAKLLKYYCDIFEGIKYAQGRSHLETDKTIQPGQYLPCRASMAQKEIIVA